MRGARGGKWGESLHLDKHNQSIPFHPSIPFIVVYCDELFPHVQRPPFPAHLFFFLPVNVLKRFLFISLQNISFFPKYLLNHR